MKFWMRVATPFTIVMSFALGAKAQVWGTGMWGGMQSCPYGYSAAAGSSSYLDEIKEAQSAISEAEKQLRAKKSEKKRLEKTMERSRRDVEEVVSEDFTEFMFEHIENNVSCKEYKGMGAGDEFIAHGQEGEASVQAPASREVRSFTIAEWSRLCDQNKNGSVSGAVCDGGRFRQTEKGRSTAQDCKKGLTDYRKNYAQSNKLQREIEGLENLIRRSKEDIQDARQNYADEMREKQRNQLEGGVCVECISQGNGYTYQKPETDWGSVVGNIGLGLAATYMGYQTNKMVANANASIGWPSQPYPAWGYGFPFLAQGVAQALGGGSGIYGAVGGGIGGGAFGCAGMNGGPYGMMGPYGGMNGSGMWGNPYAMAGMGGGLGGGIYLPGMGPWGMAGPWGMGGPFPGAMGYPMMGGMMGMPMGSVIGGGIGGVMGYPMGGMMGMPMGGMAGGMMGYPMGGMMGMPMGGMAGGMMGMPMGGMMGMPMGSIIGGGIGGMMGMPMGGMAGGMMGYPMGGMMGMPMGGMAGGMMGMPMGGMAGGMMGMPMGGMAGGMMGMPMGGMAGGMMGMPMGGMAGGMMGMPMGGMSGGLGAMQMQQQMMQMQMQQYQMYIQQQQSYMQQQMQRQQVVASLQQELYGLLYRIQQVQYGGGSYVGGSIGGGVSVGGGVTGSVITPLPGSVPSGGGTVIPGNGSGPAPIPAPR